MTNVDYENYSYDIQLRDMIVNVEGYRAKKMYFYLKDQNGFINRKDDAVQLPQDLEQRMFILDELVSYLSMNLQATIVETEYERPYQNQFGEKINYLKYRIPLLIKNSGLEEASNFLEDLAYNLAVFKHNIYEEENTKGSQL